MNDSTFYYKGYTFRLYSVGTSTTFLQVNKYNSNNIFEGNIEINNCFEKFNKFMINNQLEIEELTYEKIKLILKENERIIHTFDLSLKYNMRKIRKIQIEEINLNLTDILTSLFFFSPNNTLPKKIICGNNNGDIKIFNDSFSQYIQKKAHDKSIYFFEIKDENSFFSCSDDMTIKLWDIRDIKYINLIITIKGHNDSINKIIYLNKLLYSCSLDKSIIIYKENENSNNQYELSYTLKHKYEIFSFLLIINYSKNLLISSGADTTIIWEEKKYSIKDNKNNNEKEKLIYIEKKIFNEVSCYGNNALTNINDEMILIGGNDISVLSLKSFNLINKINIGFKCWIILPLEYNLLIGGNVSNIDLEIYDGIKFMSYDKVNIGLNNIFGMTKFIDNQILLYSKNKIKKIKYEY